MENFEDLLEDYLDQDMINEKKNIEEENIEYINTQKSINREFVRTIPIKDFVYYYLGTKHDCTNLKHKGLKSFGNPYVVGVSNDFALKNPDCVIRNEIIVVVDSYGCPGAYINPELLKKLETMEEQKQLLTLFNKIKIHDFSCLQEYFNEFISINRTILSLEKTYVDTCDLLNTIEKKYVINRIRNYAKKLKQKEFEFKQKNQELVEQINFDFEFIKEIKENIDENFETVDMRLKNRQKDYVQTSNKKISRRD